MSIDVALHHVTRYDYERPIQLYPQIVRLRPAPHARTSILSYSLKVTPSDHFINWQQDPFGNYQARLVFPERTKTFEVAVDLVASMEAINPFDFFLEEDAFHVPFSYDKDLKVELEPYLKPVGEGPAFDALKAWTKKIFLETAGASEDDRLRTIDFLVQVNQRLNQDISYTVRMEPGVQTPEDTLTLKSGSCRDSGWLLVALLREVGLAARFVSGYLIQLKADRQNASGLNGPAEDFTDLHAWTEVYVPGAGWIGLDPTSGLFAGEGHIPLAATPAPSSAAPISGAVEPCEAELFFDMTVKRVRETPRVTKPLSDEQWAAIDKAGQAVDEQLVAHDVRLTMGGEPTFVSSDDRDADEWNIAAVGPTKAAFADKLIRRLRDRFAPEGFLHHGQGKWYPGEQLPRWAYGLYWRKDGYPTWESPALIAPVAPETPATAEQAQRFSHALAANLEIDADFVGEAFEDPAEFMLREQKLAPNVDPIDNKLDEPEERQRLAKVFSRGLSSPSAYVLPIQLAQAPAKASKDMAQLAKRRRRFKWRSERWQTRRGRLYLIPGDSPAGFRLPLQSLAYLTEAERYVQYPLDPATPRGPLPTRRGEPLPQMQRHAGPASTAPLGPVGQTGGQTGGAPMPVDIPAWPYTPTEETDDEVDWRPTVEGHWAYADAVPGGVFAPTPNVRTAITIEPRNGVLCVFMPPASTADEYIDLVHAVEDTATELGIPIHIEGYPPPDDPRLNVVKVTPDPGVIEVNIQPAASWAEQCEITRTIYEEAEACGLEASKFLLDGRPTGSGGGAHVVVGGATPLDSPFLRRPDVLESLIRFWQNHPSLSYFFSGTFIGPTSQAPRVDEARQNSLYELDIALNQIPHPSSSTGYDAPPWLIDRLLRNLLVDVAGNTHRAEICIDKLYSPDGPTGRLGLVEFRAFEMPPHAEMNLAQQLLLRALIAWFWQHPYTRPLIRFGNALHDRFMLPFYLRKDFNEVLSELSEGLGIKMDPSWYDAQHEFRFPYYGQITHRDITLSLRGALEPWPVLGEEGGASGTARFVDSSVERLEVMVEGDPGSRYQIACQGYRVPLQRTDEFAKQVSGVRFRTWLPSSCLHPTIKPHSPLIFDIVDTWTGRSLGGCTYYSTHPGGRNFEFQPVNALEAEGRRRARFATMGHTPGPFTLNEPRASEEFPVTLDLMRQ
ncbi:Transglutaminase-like domain protein [Parvularcula bermudensis HTCC2503]|uniref:Transglutaminase-like domain protein n=1 Tax=Parvularcula bermudensis (strain ATCC BAA-594 / HTCC2503 / KCTC 12087) TaxID=314260 RepID=E0TEA1_PARBH|nr:transglutaminase family protein [Parvularcula bermudensis]ADM09476.1 Transglutaminase-like domain protein [Parvularcula bermudensis HTCC2503]